MVAAKLQQPIPPVDVHGRAWSMNMSVDVDGRVHGPEFSELLQQ